MNTGVAVIELKDETKNCHQKGIEFLWICEEFKTACTFRIVNTRAHQLLGVILSRFCRFDIVIQIRVDLLL